MIDVMLLADEARARGYDREPATEEQVREILRDAMLKKAREGAPTPNQVPADEVRAYFDAHRADFHDPERRRLSAIVLASEAAAAPTLQAALRASPTEWGELVRSRSIRLRIRHGGHAPRSGRRFRLCQPAGDSSRRELPRASRGPRGALRGLQGRRRVAPRRHGGGPSVDREAREQDQQPRSIARGRLAQHPREARAGEGARPRGRHAGRASKSKSRCRSTRPSSPKCASTQVAPSPDLAHSSGPPGSIELGWSDGGGRLGRLAVAASPRRRHGRCARVRPAPHRARDGRGPARRDARAADPDHAVLPEPCRPGRRLLPGPPAMRAGRARRRRIAWRFSSTRSAKWRTRSRRFSCSATPIASCSWPPIGVLSTAASARVPGWWALATAPFRSPRWARRSSGCAHTPRFETSS